MRILKLFITLLRGREETDFTMPCLKKCNMQHSSSQRDVSLKKEHSNNLCGVHTLNSELVIKFFTGRCSRERPKIAHIFLERKEARNTRRYSTIKL